MEINILGDLVQKLVIVYKMRKRHVIEVCTETSNVKKSSTTRVTLMWGIMLQSVGLDDGAVKKVCCGIYSVNIMV